MRQIRNDTLCALALSIAVQNGTFFTPDADPCGANYLQITRAIARTVRLGLLARGKMKTVNGSRRRLYSVPQGKETEAVRFIEQEIETLTAENDALVSFLHKIEEALCHE